MPLFVSYLFEVSVCLALVLLIYALFLKQTTFFLANRFYLLAGLAVAFLLPLISLPQGFTGNTTVLSELSLQKIETAYIPFNFSENDTTRNPDVDLALIALYLCGVCFFSVRLVSGIVRLFRLRKYSKKARTHGIEIFVQDAAPVFSFYKFIFAPPDVDRLVLRHEQVHVREMHWVDSLVVELVSVVLWFNPLMIFYKRAIKTLHEFLADAGAVHNEKDLATYMHCLVTASERNTLAVASHFGSNTTKHRIIMLTKNKTPLYKAMLYFIIVPAVALLLFAFQESAKPAASNTSPVMASAQSVPDGAPIESAKIKSTIGFGERLHPATGKLVKHTGVDLIADEGVDVVAAADGLVVETTFNDLKGNFVVIRHSNQFQTQYFHLLKSTVMKGSAVKKGEIIGQVGSTGVLSTNNHLHYEVLKDGEAVNPVDYLPQGYIER
ncbi:MAG TPA: peptidoglycan DD-metalloendopeptidase family protein [Chryseosolibacter sp.]